MAEKPSADARVEPVPGVATLIVPEQLADQLVEYLDTLDTGDAETSGYMLRLGVGIGMGRLAEQTQTVTNCKDTKGGADHLCDADVWIEGS